MVFITDHLIEIFFGLVSAGALAFCKRTYKQMNDYKRLLNEQEKDRIEESIDSKLQPIQEEIEELRKYIREVGQLEKNHIDLIISSYKYRLIQLCKEYIRQGYMTQGQYDQLTEFYKLYSSLGGNGQAKEYYERVLQLQVRGNE